MWYIDNEICLSEITLSSQQGSNTQFISSDIPELAAGLEQSALTFRFVFLLPDNSSVHSTPLTPQDNVIRSILPAVIYAQAGCGSVQIVVYNGDSLVWQSDEMPTQVLDPNDSDTRVIPEMIQTQATASSLLADIAVSVRDFGAYGDANFYDNTTNRFYTSSSKITAAHDDTNAITAAINSLGTTGGTIILPKGNFYVSKSINVPALVTLDLQGSAIVTNADINMVWLRQNGVIFGGRLTIYTPSYTKAALYLDGVDNFLMNNRTLAYNLSITSTNSTNPSGAGIRFYAGIESTDSHIQWVYIFNISIQNFEKGIMLQNAKSKANTWGQYINGNMFSDIGMNNCKYFVYLDGELYTPNTPWEISGNIFTELQIQTTPIIQRCFRVTSESNIIRAMTWDIVTPADGYYIEFSSQSKNNRIELYSGYIATSQILDSGRGNVVTTPASFVDNKTMDQLILPGTFGQRNIMSGEQDDFLSYMDRRVADAVVQTTGDALSGGALRNIFYPNGDEAIWATSASPVVLVIKCDAYWTGWIGLLFGAAAQNVKIEVYKDLVGQWETLLNISSNYERSVSVKSPTTFTHISLIRITMSNPAGAIRLTRVFAQSTYVSGQTWMPRIGGNIYGDVLFQTAGTGVILMSSNGTKYRLIVGDNGALSTKFVP